MKDFPSNKSFSVYADSKNVRDAIKEIRNKTYGEVW